MSCNLNHLYRNAKKCKPTMPGTGDYILVFDIDDVFGGDVLEPDTETVQSDGSYTKREGFYDAEKFVMAFTSTASTAYRIDIKADSGQVTSELAEGQEGRTLTGNAVIDKNIKEFLAVDEAMAFRNIGALIPDGNGSFYVIMSPYKRTVYTSNYDSGTTYDSDHGFTISFSCSPVLYGSPKVTLTSAQITSITKQ